MTTRAKLAAGGAVAGLVLLALAGLARTTDALFAQASPPTPTPTMIPRPGPGAPLTHELMHQTMDAMHGEGTSQRLHEAMGVEAERLIDQCVAMMNMMQGITGGTPGVMGEQHRQSMQEMMERMMGR